MERPPKSKSEIEGKLDIIGANFECYVKPELQLRRAFDNKFIFKIKKSR
jgi:hypothetical protein